MSTEKETPVENWEVWLSSKPFWEQYVWKSNLEKESLSDEDIEQCYTYLSDYFALSEPSPDKKPIISFGNEFNKSSEKKTGPGKSRIVEIKNFENINAIPGSCSVTFGPNLTLIYGGNGSGKSGIGRLLCNACFSRGKHEILPNVKVSPTSNTEPSATFVILDEAEGMVEVKYTVGDDLKSLKGFSVFDAGSILIHLDQSNSINFTPANIKIFDKVADTFLKLEHKLNNEINNRKISNPFESMFLDDATTSVAVFCKGIDAFTKETDLLATADFDICVDGLRMSELEKQIEHKKKLDVPSKKLQLVSERQNLEALKASLQGVSDRFTPVTMAAVNQILKDIVEKRKNVEALSIEKFHDGSFKTIGSAEWRALILAAKAFYDSEKAASDGSELANCMLCHQELGEGPKTLFQKYWQFLENKAERELTESIGKQSDLVKDLLSATAVFPKFLPTDAGISVLNQENPAYLAKLTIQFGAFSDILATWISRIGQLQEVDRSDVPEMDYGTIDSMVRARAVEESRLIDPSDEIATLSAQLGSLKHKKEATAVKDAGLKYIAFLRWLENTRRVNFAGIKMATTKKRTEFFLVGVARNYKGVLNQELAGLGCNFNLVMFTSGEQGNTVKEYKLDFAEDYNPSQILSEGEQNACSIADFLTEVQLDENNCGIIFDDPVTSLDHERKGRIAQRLVIEAGRRQVVIFTHDIVFMSQLSKHATIHHIPVVAHWMREVNGVPGNIELNTSPKLASVEKLKNDAKEAAEKVGSLGAKDKEQALGNAFDYLRSACEALIEEELFAETIQRYDDHIRVQNLEEAVFDQGLALRIVDLHGRISENLLAHNRSDQQSENPLSLTDFTALQSEFTKLEEELRVLRKAAIKSRDARRKATVSRQIGW